MSIKLATTDKSLSGFAGLKTVELLIEKTQLYSQLKECLPQLKSGVGRSFAKSRDLILGLIAGADCLDDMGKLTNDPGFIALCDGSVYHPKTYADFLRSFGERNIQLLQEAAIDTALNLRANLDLETDNKMILDCDSTMNRQYGEKMEGVACNYQKLPCLDTLNIYDELGFQYLLNVRPGNTHTSQGAGQAIQDVARRIKLHKQFKQKKIWVRADSGYYSSKFINSCVAMNLDLILAVAKTKGFDKLIGQIHDWTSEDPADNKRIRFYDGRECEIGTTNHRLKAGNRRLRYVVMRAKKIPPEGGLFQEHVEYDYFAFCTTLDEVRLPTRDVIFTYRKRGQAENYIKEAKYGLDLKHYPCQKLNANRAYGVLAQFAYNYMRFIALADNPTKPYYAKNIRFKWINIPCQVARTGRDSLFRVMKHHYQEIAKWLNRIHHVRV